MFCGSFSFFFWKYKCLPFSDLWLLVTHLISSNFLHSRFTVGNAFDRKRFICILIIVCDENWTKLIKGHANHIITYVQCMVESGFLYTSELPYKICLSFSCSENKNCRQLQIRSFTTVAHRWWKMILKIRLWFNDNPCFPNMSSDSFVYYLTLMPSAVFCRIINVYMTTLTTRRIIIVLSKLKIKTFLQQRYSLNYRRGILFAWKTRTSLHHFTKGGCSGTIEQIYPNHIWVKCIYQAMRVNVYVCVC